MHLQRMRAVQTDEDSLFTAAKSCFCVAAPPLLQLLCGVAFLHAAKIIHRDLKPGNILVNQNCDLKICDFGLARSFSGPTSCSEDQQQLTMYVTTRWYRAPELLCLSPNYGPEVDLWSTGCIIAEMMTRQPLLPGREFSHQLRLIITLVGMPTEEEMAATQNAGAINFLQTLRGHVEQEPLSSRLQDVNPQALDLLTRMLAFEPSKRISAEEALQHPYLHSYKDDIAEEARALGEGWGAWEGWIGGDAHASMSLGLGLGSKRLVSLPFWPAGLRRCRVCPALVKPQGGRAGSRREVGPAAQERGRPSLI